MSLLKWMFIGLVLLPAAEIAAFLLVAAFIGWLSAIGLFIATSALGVLILRRSGRENLSRFATAVHQNGLRAIHLDSPGFASMLGGILLVVPGFITDAVGLLQRRPPLRRWAVSGAGRTLQRRRRRARDTSIIDS